MGRTACFIVIDSMLERVKYENTVDIYGHVTVLRTQRNFMVQTEVRHERLQHYHCVQFLPSFFFFFLYPSRFPVVLSLFTLIPLFPFFFLSFLFLPSFPFRFHFPSFPDSSSLSNSALVFQLPRQIAAVLWRSSFVYSVNLIYCFL